MSSVDAEVNDEWVANNEVLESLQVSGTAKDSEDEKEELETIPVDESSDTLKVIDVKLPNKIHSPPTSSVLSLPPLPDLIPIRKASVNLSNLPGNPQKVSGLEGEQEEDPGESSHSNEAEQAISSEHSDGCAEEATEVPNTAEEVESGIEQLQLSPAATPPIVNTEDNQIAASESNASNTTINNINEPSDQPSAMQELQPDQPMVQHRKSDRRRVGRDIFFFFEEHPANRRKSRQTKRSPQKRGRPRAGKTQPPPKLQIPQPTKREALTSPEATTPTTTDSTPTTPRVNPIFLWVKQDDTRIVEVRCEDYDKRNRIRLTKTANGWRAIPRTDPTSSRVVKLLPNPMVHVKQEPKPDLLQSTSIESDPSKASETACSSQEDYEAMKTKKSKKKKKKKKKRKHDEDKERESEKPATEEERNEPCTPASVDPLSDIPKILSPAPADIVIYESTNHERNESEQDEQMEVGHSDVADENSALIEPNNNDSTVDLTKNLTQLSDDMELNMPQFIIRPGNSEPEMILCPETGEFRRIDQVGQQQSATVDLTNSEADLNESFDVDTKHLKELLDNEDLLSHCDNGMTGAELIDSLVKRGCEDNHISEEDQHQIKETICLTDDFENEEEEILMRPEPVEDIISRLGESLTTSPKCLSFNEAGEIEGLHGELFQNSSNQSDPFNSRNTLEELSITIKDLESIPAKTTVEQAPNEAPETTTIVSPDSCVDELPKDLTCKKVSENSALTKSKDHPHNNLHQPQMPPQPQRTNSRSSDAIQSPQPSGLPAVPPSPDIVHSNKTKSMFLDQLLNQNSTSPKICSSVTVTPVSMINSTTKVAQQKEPLDLGKHRKSASPTVSCSEEAKRTMSSDEPVHKRIKTEPVSTNDPKNGTNNSDLADLLQPAKDPDPLTQLRLLISNPEWKVPDPILVPKDRLSAVLASPAREIPLLLTTRPELRLPEAFAYPSILKDPDILVISMAQLEAILQKQVEITRPKSTPVPQVTIEPVTRPRQDKQAQQHDVDNRNKNNMLNPLAPLMTPGLANDIDAATLAAFNQMFWLPYLSQMAPELFKAMAGLPNNANLAELLPFLAQQQQQQQQQQQKLQHQQQQQPRNLYNPQFNANAMAFQNPLELAMWQEALGQAQMQQALKMQRENQQSTHKKPTTPTDAKPNVRQQHNMTASLLAQNKQPQQQQKTRTNYGINPFRTEFNRMPNRQTNNTSRTDNQFLSPSSKATKQSQQGQHQATQQNQNSNPSGEQKPRVTLKSLSNLLEPERLLSQGDPKMSANLMAMPGFDFTQNQQSLQQQQYQFGQFGSTAGGVSQTQHQQHPQHPQQQQQQQQTQAQPQLQGKLKVKPGAHLLDPAAMQRRLLNYDEIPEVGSTTNGLDDMMNDPNAPLWHPLFGR